MQRRTFLATSVAGLAVPCSDAAAPAFIIDTHTHFYDPSRPQGVPWPPKDDPILYRTVLPREYRLITAPLGITGTIEVEASPWLEDNQWVLDLAERETIIVGTVGDLEPGKPEFRAHLDRFHRNLLFRGIRLGTLWSRNLDTGLPRERYVADLKALSQAGLEIDVVGGPRILPELVRLTDAVPDLRVVIDHLPFDVPAEPEPRAAYGLALRELGKRPQVYAKVSNVVRRVAGRVPDELNFYRPALDELWETFGVDRVIYGSNWPVSDKVAPYATLFKIVRDYFSSKGQEATEKYFWRNSQAAYRWVKR